MSKAIGEIAQLRDKVATICEVGTPKENGRGPKGNPSSAQGKSKDSNRKKRNKGRH